MTMVPAISLTTEAEYTEAELRAEDALQIP